MAYHGYHVYGAERQHYSPASAADNYNTVGINPATAGRGVIDVQSYGRTAEERKNALGMIVATPLLAVAGLALNVAGYALAGAGVYAGVQFAKKRLG